MWLGMPWGNSVTSYIKSHLDLTHGQRVHTNTHTHMCYLNIKEKSFQSIGKTNIKIYSQHRQYYNQDAYNNDCKYSTCSY